MSKPDPSKYSVGYKKPPRHTQFKPGESGNPKGRPKRLNAEAEIYNKALREPMWIKVNGRQKKLSTYEVILMQRVNKARKGFERATDKVLEFVRSQAPDSGDNLTGLLEEMRTAHARLEAAAQEAARKAEVQDPSEKDHGSSMGETLAHCPGQWLPAFLFLRSLVSTANSR
ncbi:MAG: hypothetical protein H0X25_16910 [Acidobacteriales bacterium]|nr:hypothetical protein [Terriglobales bacterium]